MSQSSWQQQQHHLDSLQSMVNAVLIETGKALRSANANGVKTIGYSHGRIKAFLPTALDKFHLALDELENDIVRAQAVLSRDLRELRARQHELDNPTVQHVEGTPLPWEMDEIPTAGSPHAQEAKMLTSVPESKDETTQDGITSTGIAVSSPGPKAEAPSDATSLQVDLMAPLKSMELPQKPTEEQKDVIPSVDDVSKISNDAPELEVATGLGIDLSGADQSLPSEAPGTADLQSESFDSIFGIGPAGDTDLNFDDFDFNTGHETHDYDQNDGDLDLSSFGNQESNNKNDDVSTLLQGLEGFGDGNTDGDFNPLNISNNIAANEIGADQGVSTADDYGMSGGDLDMAMGMGNNESTFDDLLEGMDVDVEFGNEGSGEFDDAFFNM